MCAPAPRVPPRACRLPPAVDFNILVPKSFYQSDYFNSFAVQ